MHYCLLSPLLPSFAKATIGAKQKILFILSLILRIKVPTDFPSCLGIPEWCHKPLNSKYMCSGRNALYVSLYNKRPRSYFPVFIFLHTRFHHYHRHCWQQKQQQLTHPLCLLFLLEYSLSLVWLMLWKICLFCTHLLDKNIHYYKNYSDAIYHHLHTTITTTVASSWLHWVSSTSSIKMCVVMMVMAFVPGG